MESIECKKKPYPAKAHARRVAQALAVKTGLIVLSGRTTRLYDDSDMGRAFRQRRYFYYLSGVRYDADCLVSFDIAADVLTLWVPAQRSPREILYMGPVISPERAVREYAVDGAGYAADLDACVDEYLERGGTVYLLHEDDKYWRDTQLEWLRGGMRRRPTPGHVDGVKLIRAMNACRVIKDDWEIAAIREANRITAVAHVEVLKHMTMLSNEAAVEGIYTGTCIASGAKAQAYAPIAGSGMNAATLHYTANNEPLKGRQLLLLDAGAEYSCYASDVTRTFPISLKDGGWPSQEAKRIYDLVAEMQESCISRVKPGVLFRDLNVLAHYIAVRGLLKLGILHNGTVEEIVKAGTSLAFLPHGLGHHLGLEVHDVEDYDRPMLLEDENDGIRTFGLCTTRFADLDKPFAEDLLSENRMDGVEFEMNYGHLIRKNSTGEKLCSFTQGLRAGMVVTVEPGIYFNAFAFREIYLPNPVHRKYINEVVLASYMEVGGVRIEDDILVTQRDGYENLTITPKGKEAIKIIRDGPKSEWSPSHGTTRSLRSALHLADE